MKRQLAIAFIAALTIQPASALAKSTGLEPAFGNTIVSTYPDGRTGKLWLEPGGTYRAQGRRKTFSSGTWAQKGPKICLKQRKPHSIPFSYCTEIRSGGVGTTWTDKAVTGERITVRLVAGR